VGAKASGAGFAGAKRVDVTDAGALVSDDDVEFCAIDLPGIADAENTGSKSETDFTALALKWASACDVVVWVTDARTAFLTTHETREFTDMRRALQKIADEDGKLFQFCILLAKYETDEAGAYGPTGAIGPAGAAIKVRAGEITRPTEHSTIADHEARIRGLFGMSKGGPQGIVIAKFSAHNRIACSSSASAALKALALSSSGATGPKAHTTFDLKWATEDLPERRLAQMKRALCAAKSRAEVSSKYRAEVEAGIKALSGSARLCDVLELGRRAAYAATAAVLMAIFLVLCLVMHIARLCVSSVRRVSLASVPVAVPKVLVIVVGIYFLAQCATSLEFTDLVSLTRHDGTSPSERAEETDPSWADSCTFRPEYAPVCETPYPGKWYLKLAEQGKLRNAREQYELGRMYYEGKGVALDLTEAAKWYRESASQGNADAQLRLGRMYQYGNGVALDLVEAAKWFRTSASQGNADAQFAIGSMYHYGTGVELDLTEAAKWYSKSAHQGDASAQLALGHMFYTGKGVSLDLTEAAKWYRESASQGNALSQFWLGTMYSDGKGVAHDPVEAAKWYERAKSAS
jgi:hypothetical protein